MTGDALEGAFFTTLRASLDAMAADVDRTLSELGFTEYRPRFSAVIRVVDTDGPCTIRHLATRMRTTHSAASQTVSQMTTRGLVELRTGTDARQRLIHLTPRATALLPLIDREWAAYAAAVRELGTELSAPLETIVRELETALARRSFHDRMTAQLRDE